ncbi:MAG: hypothetical protein WC584_01470 [Candidatus Pacearchaeota archaeon]
MTATRTHREIIEDVCCDENCEGKYCILKEIVLLSDRGDRFLEQTKCVERFKYERSNLLGRDIGWEEAHKIWIQEGFAQKFAELYEDGMKNGHIYKLIMQR